MGDTSVLILVEGKKPDKTLMRHLLEVYGISASRNIVSYNTNIYTLYHQISSVDDFESFDLLLLLREREKNEENKAILNQRYSDILLVFDLDPQAPDYAPEKIKFLAGLFTESSDMGKLYINYPMVESFYHMKSIPDPEYDSYKATLQELRNGEFKSRVNRENRNHNYQKFAVDKKECDIVIRQNIEKAQSLVGDDGSRPFEIPSTQEILETQLSELQSEFQISVLCTCVFYIAEYNPKLLIDDEKNIKN